MSAALNFLAGMGDGFLKGQRRQQEDDRQAKLDQIVFDRADAEKKDRDRVETTRNRVADAYAPVTMQGVMTKPDTADNRDVGTPGTDLQPTGQVRVGQQVFEPGREADAQAAVTAANAPEAQTGRASQAMLSMGDVGGAQALRTGAKQEKVTDLQLQQAVMHAKTEGLAQALSAALSGAPTDQVKEIFNSQGANKITDLKVEPFETTHPVLGKIQSAKVTGTDAAGKPFEIPDAAAASFALFSAEKRFTMQAKAQEEKRLQGNTDRQQTETERHNRAGESILATKADNANSGSTRRADHYEDKAWDSVRKVEQALVSVDGGDGKAKELSDLRLIYSRRLNELQAQGDMSPNEAAEAARSSVIKIKDIATARVAAARDADPRSKLTESQVVKSLLKEYDDRQKAPAGAPAPASTPPPKPAAPAVPLTSMAAEVGKASAPSAPPPGLQPTGDAVLNDLQQRRMASIRPLVDAVKSAEAQMSGAAKSGDPVALKRYAQALQDARNARDAALEKNFGNQAPAVLQSLSQ